MFVSNHSLVGSAATSSWETRVRALTSISVLLRFILSVRLRCGPGSVPGLPSHDVPLGHGRGGRCLSPPSITPLKPLYNPLTRQGLRQQRQKLRTNWLCSWRSVLPPYPESEGISHTISYVISHTILHAISHTISQCPAYLRVSVAEAVPIQVEGVAACFGAPIE